MRSSVTVQASFSASHQVEWHAVCDKPHGHLWTVAVTVEEPISPKTGVVNAAQDLSMALAMRITVPLDHRDLNTMLPGVVPLPEGIASWVRERLLLDYPRITAVRVDNGDYAALLEWEIR